MNHELKTDPDAYDDVRIGIKKFEIRKKDRDFRVGDILVLQETKHTGAQMADGAPLVYTGDELRVLVTHIMQGPIYGLADGWVIMSIYK